MGLLLVIGNKNYSSWSMRPWVLMKQLGIAFDELKLRFDEDVPSPFKAAVARYSPAGRVPVLVDTLTPSPLPNAGEGASGFAVWDTLAIAEYLHEKYPTHGVWPQLAQRRARARSLCAEMHAGFAALRSHCPMNIEARLPEAGARVWADHEAVRNDVARIERMWREELENGGPFMFGEFSAADAFYAPVCMRLRSYALPVSPLAAAYVERVAAAPGVRQWIEDALAEKDFLQFEEPYRSAAT